MRMFDIRFKPSTGFSHIVHGALVSLMPTMLFIITRLQFFQLQLGIALILLSKWRMFAVKPRHWFANIRANAVDIIVSLSCLMFMIHGGVFIVQFTWAVIYGIWLMIVKPKSSTFGVILQALIAQSAGMMALTIAWGGAHSLILVLGAWVINYMSARHFFAGFEEPMARYLSQVWGYFSASLLWILSHWLLFYGPIAQPALLLTVIGFGLGGMYYLEKSDRMSTMLQRQINFVVFAVVMIVITLSYWGNRTI